MKRCGEDGKEGELRCSVWGRLTEDGESEGEIGREGEKERRPASVKQGWVSQFKDGFSHYDSPTV